MKGTVLCTTADSSAHHTTGLGGHLLTPNPAFWLHYLFGDFSIFYIECQDVQVAPGNDANHMDHSSPTGIQQLVLSALTAREAATTKHHLLTLLLAEAQGRCSPCPSAPCQGLTPLLKGVLTFLAGVPPTSGARWTGSAETGPPSSALPRTSPPRGAPPGQPPGN